MATSNAQLRERLKNVELDDLAVGTQLMLQTADRKHPFRATIRKRGRYNIVLDTKGTTVELILREDGSISHVVRYAVRPGAFPQQTQLRWWKLAE